MFTTAETRRCDATRCETRARDRGTAVRRDERAGESEHGRARGRVRSRGGAARRTALDATRALYDYTAFENRTRDDGRRTMTRARASPIAPRPGSSS